MKGTGAKRNVCPGSCVSTGAKFPVAPVESAPMLLTNSKPVDRDDHQISDAAVGGERPPRRVHLTGAKTPP